MSTFVPAVRDRMGALVTCTALLAGAGCGEGGAGLPPLESSDVVLPAFDSTVVHLVEGTGEERDASGTLVVEAGLTDWRAVGDFDADGTEEAVAVVWSSGGGSGTFMDLSLFTLDRGGWTREAAWRWRASRPLGDRVRVRALAIDGARVEVHVTRHGPDDPMCCPTEQAVLAFRVAAGGLREEGGP